MGIVSFPDSRIEGGSGYETTCSMGIVVHVSSGAGLTPLRDTDRQ